MNDAVPAFHVSARYLRNLWVQATFGGIGILVGWILFLVVSLPIRPAMLWEELLRLPWRLFTDSRLWLMPSPDEIRELIRFGVGPGLALCAVLGGLADFSSWVAVRYEIHPDKLRMIWRRLTREIAWDLIKTVDERPHAEITRRSLKISQDGAGPILVRGLEQLPEFIEILQSRLPRLSRWSVSAVRVDLTSGLTNLVLGFLLMLPFSITWIAYYVAHAELIALFWSVILLVAALWIWFWRPLSRSHMCVREVEISMAVMILVLSGAMTFLNWIESPATLPTLRSLGI